MAQTRAGSSPNPDDSGVSGTAGSSSAGSSQGSGGSSQGSGGAGGSGGPPAGGGGGGGGAGGTGAGTGASGFLFGLTPAAVNSAAPIDYSTSQGTKIYNAAVKELSVKYSLEHGDANQANQALMDRANEMSWGAIGADILLIPDSKGNSHHLISEYGQLTMEDIKTHVQTYIGTNTRRAQNAVQMANCLLNSITDTAQKSLVAESDVFHINGVPNGPLLFKHFMFKTVIDTRATVTSYRKLIGHLDSFMTKCNFDIDQFNSHAKKLILNLKSRGERTDEAMVNVFEAYEIVPDQEFNRYIKGKRDDYDEGRNITLESLMNSAKSKYDILKEAGTWNALSPDQEKIVALTAEISQLKDKKLKLANNLKGSSSSGSNSNKSGNKKKDNKKGKKKGKKKKDSDYAWKKVPPGNGVSHTKTVNNKMYHWCDHHQAWTIHSPAECNQANNHAASGSGRTGSSNTSNSSSGGTNVGHQATVVSGFDSDEE